MRGYIANTDYDWYRFLKGQPQLEEVNFWQPSGKRRFLAVEPGSPFFFKLKKPHYVIGGFGIFAGSSRLPAWLAWDSFGIANGAVDLPSVLHRIERYRPSESIHPYGDFEIGCLMISNPIFFEERDWIEQPRDWKANIVQGATYDLTQGEGRRIYDRCRLVAEAQRTEHAFAAFESDRYGNEQIIRPRLGQGTFRVAVLDAYSRACAVSQEHSLPVLEAAHIKPYAESGPHAVSNGLLLRADIHRLYDMGYVGVTPDYRFEVSRRLKDDFSNGRSYYPLHGRRIQLPADPSDRPDASLLAWRHETRFRA